MFYTIDNYTINIHTHEICYKNIPQKIKPLIFKLLRFMLENPQRVLTRDELILNVWNNSLISDSALSAAISVARNAIGDSGQQQKYIKTISGHGYRFVGTFSYQERKEISPNTLSRTKNIAQNISKDDQYHFIVNQVNQKPESLILPDKPSIAIMDIFAMKNEPEQQFLVHGLTIEINAGLSRLPHLFVIARASSAYLSKISLLPSTIGQYLGVRYLLYGHAYILNKRLLVTLSLVDTGSSEEIWSEHFNVIQNDVTYLQNKIVNDIVTVINDAIEQAEIERSFLIPNVGEFD